MKFKLFGKEYTVELAFSSRKIRKSFLKSSGYSAKPWTDEEIKTLERHIELDTKPSEIMKHFPNRTRNSIYCKRQKMTKDV